MLNRHPEYLKRQSGLIYFCVTLLALSVHVSLGQNTSLHLEARSDVIGRHRVANAEQCRRMCWYRTVCNRYSYRNARRAQYDNCLLHVTFEPATPLPTGWTTAYTSSTGIRNGCADRPCAESEICLPWRHSREQHRCVPVPVPVDCGLPSVSHGSFMWSGTGQGDSATLTCDPYYEVKPADTSELTCEADGEWMPAGVSCELTCINGGTEDGDQCRCPLQFSGTHCERYIRDCTEAYDNSDNPSTDRNGVYFIQPVSAPSKFLVHCDFSYGGVTHPLKRQSMSYVNMDWTTAKEGLISNLEQDPNSMDFFIGLENLHVLTTQAVYECHVSLWGGLNGAGSKYFNFTIGPESSNYVLQYDSFTSRSDDSGGNGFEASQPVTFSTSDRDQNDCTVSRNAPGWYGSDCQGYTLFGSEIIWPSYGYDTEWNAVVVKLNRQGKFYVDQN